MAKKTDSDRTPNESRKTVKRTTAGATAHKDDRKDDKGKDAPPPAGDDKAKAEAKSGDKDGQGDSNKKSDDKDDKHTATKADAAKADASPKADKDDDKVERPAQETKAPANAQDKASAAPQPAQAAPAPAEDSAPRFEPLVPPTALPTDQDPNASAPPPGLAPPGDSRSLRRQKDGVEEFVFIYRSTSYLIQRTGKVGTKGRWSCVEYPHIGAASHAYAQECSRLTDEGFRDLR